MILWVALVCERLHVLPEQVLDHDYALLMQVWDVLGEVDRVRNRPAKKGRK